jgi:hypothetical protein
LVRASNGNAGSATILILKYKGNCVDHAAILRRGTERQIFQQSQQRLPGMAEALGEETKVVAGCQRHMFFTASQQFLDVRPKEQPDRVESLCF